MEPPDPPDGRGWKQSGQQGVTYTSDGRPRCHTFLESYEATRPDQPNRELIDAYYSADISGTATNGLNYWTDRPHRAFVLEAQSIRMGWIDEISQSDRTPSYDLTELGVTPLERARGALAGLAVGDALGRPVEFWSRDRIEEEYGFLDSYQGHGSHGMSAGTVSDDTEQALCIATSLASRGEWDPEAVAAQFVDWHGSAPFDIGGTTSRSMEHLASGVDWDEAGEMTRQERSNDRATNGSVMRCAPLAIAYPNETEKLIQYSRESSIITHAHPKCAYGAAILNLTIANLLTYTEEPLSRAIQAADDDAPSDLTARLSSIEDADEASLSSSGDVTDTLETALYYALTSSTFFEAVTEAVNTGGDTDTVGAITGAVAGARFGIDPTLDQQESGSIDPQLLEEPNVTDLLLLPDHVHEIEDGVGTLPAERTWRDCISTL